MELPVVTVAMPNYNDAAYIREALDSVLKQSFGSFEFVIVDDGSTDESFEILSEYAARDPRLRIFRNERNQGVLATIKRLESLARGRYVYWLASNDKALPGFFEKTVAALEAHPQAGLCWTDPGHFFESDGPIYGRRVGLTAAPGYISPEELAGFYRDGRLSAPLHAAPAMFRRSAYMAAGGCLPELRWYCDFFVTLAVAFRSGMCHVPEVLTATRVLTRSFWRSGSGQKEVQQDVLTTLLDLLISPDYRDLRPRVQRSGVLAYFGLPMYRRVRAEARYHSLLERRYFGRCVAFSVKHAVRRVSSLRFQRLYFLARQTLRPSAARPVAEGKG